MRNRHLIFICFLILFGSSAMVYAQQTTIQIVLVSPPASIPSCTVGISGNEYEVIVPANWKPKVSNSQNATISIEGDNVIFSFSIDSSVRASCMPTKTGFDINIREKTGTQVFSEPTPTPTPKPLTKDELTEVKKDNLDLSVPESPGFTILGLTPQTVIRPTSPRAFAASLLNGMDENGNIQSGVALDFSPYQLLFHPTLQEYRNEDLSLTPDKRKARFSIERVLSRLQFSLATVKGASETDKSAKIGTGLHFTVFDNGDPRLDKEFDNCFNKFDDELELQAAKNLNVNPNPLQRTGPQEDLVLQEKIRLSNDSFREKFKKTCVEDSRKRNFGRSSLVIGGAGSWISKNGDSSKFTNNGTGLWTSLAYGFEGVSGLEKKAQVIFHFRRRYKEEVPDPLNEGEFITKDSNLFGVRLRFGSPNWAGNIEGVYQGERFAGREADSNFKMSFGSDYRLASNLYLNFSIGGETKKSNISDNKVFVRTSFNWGVSQKPLDEQ